VFTESAELYDLIYSSFKDYPGEARDIAALLRRVRPDCHTVLDVACGTGEHARLLAADHGFRVDGLDLDPAFVKIAAAKHPAGRFQTADMIDFHLGRRYDAVLCLFSSIGYARTLSNVRRALACFREHLADGGVVIVEPWFPPGVLDPARTDTRTIETKGLCIVRTGRVEIEGGMSRVLFDYEIDEGGEARHAREVHELGLFTTSDMLRCFEDAGLEAEHDAGGLSGRGLFVAKTVA
jgi:SAM-dependent methyltransferase